MTLIGFDIFTSNRVIAKIADRDFDLVSEGIKFKNNVICLKRYEPAQECAGDICRFWHLLSNGATAKIELRDIDKLLKVNDLKFVYVWNG